MPNLAMSAVLIWTTGPGCTASNTLARRVIEFSFSLPESVRYHDGQLKGLLKYAYKDILPAHILHRRKKGFGIPRYYLQDLDGGRSIQEHVLRSLFL